MANARVRVRLVPASRRDGVVGRHGAAWKIRVRAPAERGAANDALLSLLADTLAVARADVRLVAGHTVRDKIVELTGLGEAAASARLSSSAERGTQ